MESKTIELINFLKELYKDTITEDKELEVVNETFVLDLDLEDLWDTLRDKWGFLDESALDINDVAEDYNLRKQKWESMVEDAEKLSDLDFIKKHSIGLSWRNDESELTDEIIRFEN